MAKQSVLRSNSNNPEVAKLLADFDDIEYDLGCLMWYPNDRILLPVTKFNLLQRKANTISVEYVKLVQDPTSEQHFT